MTKIKTLRTASAGGAVIPRGAVLNIGKDVTAGDAKDLVRRRHAEPSVEKERYATDNKPAEE